MISEKFYKASVERIRDFYTLQIDNTNIETEIFKVLKNIIPFDTGKIFYYDGEDKNLVYSYNKGVKSSYYAEENLCLSDIPFGLLVIGRNNNFSNDEITVFKTCASIISSIIKDIEMNSIVKAQLDMLQSGISEKSSAYKRILEEEKTKNKFIANVSHELRSPLNSIMGFADLLQSQFAGKLNEKQREYIDDIKIASIHLLNMVNEILDMSKIESGTMKIHLSTFPLALNVKEALNILKPLYINKNLKVKLFMDETTEITADYQKLQQIVLNLLGNAIKHSPENGTIEILSKQTKQFTTFSIKDNGCGIDKKYHKKIFNKFEQIVQTTNSTGLGLTITRELVKLHNGKISVKSETGKGAEFTVKLPNS